MARAAVLGRLSWRIGEVSDIADETAQVRSLSLTLPGWPGHRPGQHVDIRLTAEDGYQAVRSYSIASPPETPDVTVTVERLPDGEVSPYLTEEVRQGDRLEVRGPIGGYFVWDRSDGGPLFLVAGGSGVVPLMSMIRHRDASSDDTPTTLLYSVKTPDDVIYRGELDRLGADETGIRVVYTFTRGQPPGWSGYSRRVDASMLQEIGPPSGDAPLIFVCGPTQFVESVSSALVAMGHDPARVKTERFGPTGR
jgi:ferredoxin-NADP reductase